MPRIVIVAVFVAAIIGAAAFYLVDRGGDAHRPEAARETSAIATPTVAEPREKADVEPAGGIATSATAAPNSEDYPGSGLDVRTLAACHRNLLTKQHVERYDCEGIKESESTRREFCRSQLAMVNLRLQELSAGAASCPESLAEPSVYYRALRNLALAGDVGAQRCYIQGYFGQSHEDGKHLAPGQSEEYVLLARKFIDAALERGDWSVVRWLGRIRLDMQDGTLVTAYPVGQSNPDTIYKMKYLLVLGNQGDPIDASDPKKVVEAWRRDKALTEQQFQQAEEWARSMYAQHFTGSEEGRSTGVLDFCDSR
jgi:hypothetical protein